MKPDLILLTYGFPNTSNRAEDWLIDEINITSGFYNKISVFPDFFSQKFHPLPTNCEVVDLDAAINLELNFKELLNSLKIVLSDFSNYPSKANYFKSFRYNLALVKGLHLKAKKINSLIKVNESNTIVYAYWADNLATTACILKKEYMPKCKVVTRGHGFEIFEEQTKNGLIPFRIFQLNFLDRLFADSKRGMTYLNKVHPNFIDVNGYSYVGTKDLGLSNFDQDKTFAIVTCSFVRDVKRLYLMAGILKHIKFDLIWHILGDGDDMERVKNENSKLPSNIKVVYHGLLDNIAILNFYKNTHVNLFASLSYSEGLPVTMMEAQSFGIPIMSTDVGGCSEICNEETGFLIEKDFLGNMVAGKITEFKNSLKNTKIFRIQCREYWEKNFNAKKNYSEFSKLITTLN